MLSHLTLTSESFEFKKEKKAPNLRDEPFFLPTYNIRLGKELILGLKWCQEAILKEGKLREKAEVCRIMQELD